MGASAGSGWIVPGGVAESPGAGRLVNGGLPEDSAATTNGRSWPGLPVRGSISKLTFSTSERLRRWVARGDTLTTRERILQVPQLDGRPSWEPQATPFLASRGTRARSSGRRAPFKVKDIWALRVRLESRVRELALFNLGIDGKLRGCDLVALKVRDVCHGDQVATRAIVMQHKTQRPVQFEITHATREALQAWIKQASLKPEDFLFPSRLHDSPHLGTR